MTSDTQVDAAGPLDEVERYLARYPDTEALELLIADTNAVMRGKWAPASTIEKAFTTGVAFPLSMFGLDVWGREVMETGLHVDTGDRDGFCTAVPGSLRPVPWADIPTAQVMLTMTTETGEPFHGDPRRALEKVVARAAGMGLRACVAFELEFYLLTARPGETQAEAFRPVLSLGDGPDRQNMYALSDLSAHASFFSEVRAGAAAQGLPIDTILSEAAPGQFEINLKHRTDAMGAADDALLLKRLIQETARRHQLRATFMAKPFMAWAGNGMHVHVSLVDGADCNIFADPSKGETVLESAVAGLIDTMAASMLVFVPTWNGYRRLLPGSYAPTRAAWGHNNRSVAVRIPAGEGAATRIEHRISGADANPYLALAAVLAAMLDGIEGHRKPPPPTDRNAYEAPAPELPDQLDDAVRLFRKSDFIRRTFGVEYRSMFAAIKDAEIAAFREEISPLERATYL
ncbi:glutamine synthetase family protein [Amorphus orientalis]|uniref:Glutamine synthetase n=1 Tax=Amorphus orientalis TaxID=649198 RepID=A0AAE3VMJ4_9HYPH|nr:glutamine synthetase family protein [Amorphus orientalis]MDQ0315249.1 glutamine synthetase [Amorphus orientalis]